MRYLSVLSFLILAACSPVVQADGGDILTQLLNEGILASFEPRDLTASEFDLIQVERGNLEQTFLIPVTIHFPRWEEVRFEVETIGPTSAWIDMVSFTYGVFSGTHLRVGDFVNEGDFIAELTYQTPASLIIDRRELEFERSMFEADFANERSRRSAEIEDLRRSAEMTSGNERTLLALRIERAELQFTQFLRDMNNRRTGFERREEDLLAPTAGERLYAPISGIVTNVTAHTEPGMYRDLPSVVNWMGLGNVQVSGRLIAEILDLTQVEFHAEANLHALRFGDIITMTDLHDTLSFDVRVVSDLMTQNISRSGTHSFRLEPVCFDEMLESLEAAGMDVLTLWSQNVFLRVRPTISLAIDAPIVRSSAVTEENGQFFVMLYTDGELVRRYVDIGAAIGDFVQIISGLEPGQWVAR